LFQYRGEVTVFALQAALLVADHTGEVKIAIGSSICASERKKIPFDRTERH